MWYWEKEPNLKKWVKVLQKRPLAPIAAKPKKAGPKLFLLEDVQEPCW